MLDRSDVIYQYDGSFDGLLCCVFESYDQQEIPAQILSPGEYQAVLFPIRTIATDEQRASRVMASIPKKMGGAALDFLQHAFLTCLPQKELHILLFLRLGYRHGPSVMSMLTNDVVDALHKAVMHLTKESHLLTGFVRFSVANNALTAVIEPKNCVLPLLAPHFCERYPEESFLIYDKTHGMALIYQPHRHVIMPIDDLQLPEPDQEELAFRELWRLFHDTIAVEGRYNPKGRQSHMPKRYWKYLTEFNHEEASRLKLVAPASNARLPRK